MTVKIKKLIKKRNKAWKRYDEEPNFKRHGKYKDLRNKVTKEIRTRRKMFEESLARKIKEQPKAFYSYVRSKTKTKERVGPLLNNDGIVTNNKKEMSGLLNEFFASVFTKEDKRNIPELILREEDNQPIRVESNYSDIEITEEGVLKVIKGLKANKTGGVDDLNSSYLMGIAEVIAAPLTEIYRKSLEEGDIPNDWKKANITPIFKKGAKSNRENYRPVSLTSHVCKIMEKIVVNGLNRHLEKNKLIEESQHGFRNKKSCLTNLLEFVNETAISLDEGKPVDIIYLDFKKAFDTVPHKRLYAKLKAHGVEGRILNWIKEWLNNRRQRVVLNGEKSEWAEVESGVPQGSVLGPVLFTIYINDIDQGIKNTIKKFADDTKLIGKAGSEEEVNSIKEDLKKLHKWTEDWQMKFNADKCKVLHLGRQNREGQYNLEGVELEKIAEEKDLGVYVEKNFKVGKQCTKAAAKGNQILGLIARTFVTRSREVIMSLYKTLVRPHLEYCVQAWRPHLKKDIEKIEKVQRRATRMMMGSRELDYESRLRKVGLTTLETRRLRADMIEVYKIVNGMEGITEAKMFKRDGGGRRGHKFKLYKKRVRLDIAKYTFANRVCTPWNNLPKTVVEATSVDMFKGKLDNYLRVNLGMI